MNALFIVGVIVGFVGLLLFIYGAAAKKQVGVMMTGFILVVVITGLMIALCARPASSETYRVVYSKGYEIVVIDDDDGSTSRFNLNKITHDAGEYQIGDHVTVIVNAAGKPMFITTNTEIVVPVNEPQPTN